MTMPDKIWASEVKAGYGEWQDAQDGLPIPTPYIRADIVEELLMTLEWYNDGRDPVVSEVMSRINAIMEGK